MMKILNAVLRLALAGIFIYASYGKILHPVEFAEAVRAYRILPDMLINPVAVGLPWLELILGVLLAVNRWQFGALFWANLLLSGFLAGIVVNLARGVDVHCGCFTSSASGDPEMLWYVIRDSAFLLLGAATAWSQGRVQRTRRLSASTVNIPFRQIGR